MAINVKTVGTVALATLCIFATERVTASGAWRISSETKERMTVRDSATVSVGLPSKTDVATISDSLRIRLSTLQVSRTETVAVFDARKLAGMGRDAVAISASPTVQTITPCYVYRIDKLTANETRTLSRITPRYAYRVDTVRGQETRTAKRMNLRVSRTDKLTTGDTRAAKRIHLRVSRIERVTLREQHNELAPIPPALITVTKTERVTTSETRYSPRLDRLVQPTGQVTTVSDSKAVYILSNSPQSKTDQATVSDSRRIAVTPLPIYAKESVTASTQRTPFLPYADRFVSKLETVYLSGHTPVNLNVLGTERVSIREQHNELISSGPVPLYVSRIDKITVSSGMPSTIVDRDIWPWEEYVTIRESRTAFISPPSLVVGKTERVSVSDAKAVKVLPLVIHEQESVTASDGKTSLITGWPLEVTRAETVTLRDQNNELTTFGIVPHAVFKTEKITLSDGRSFLVAHRPIGPREERATVSALGTARIVGDLSVAKTEWVTARDSKIARLPVLRISAQDSVTASDSRAVFPFLVPLVHQTEWVSLFEAWRISSETREFVGVSEHSTVYPVGYESATSKSDATTVSDNPRVRLAVSYVSEFDSATISETKTVRITSLRVHGSDSVTASDSRVSKVAVIIPARTDSATISDSAAVNIARLRVSAQETVTASETPTKRDFDPVWLRKTEKVTASETPTIEIDFLRVSATETITASDQGNVASGLPVLGWNSITIQGIELISGKLVIIKGMFQL